MVSEILAAAAVAAAFFVQRLTGFGAGLMATPLLVLFLSPYDAIPLMLVYQNAFAVMLIGETWRALLDTRLRLFLAFFMAGIVVGIYALPGLPETLIYKGMAAVVLIALVQWLVAPSFEIPIGLRPLAAAAFGALSGLTQGAFGIGGPFFLLYFGNVEKKPDKLRAALISTFFVGNILRLPVALATAQFNSYVLCLVAFAALPFILAMWIGAGLARKVEERVFRFLIVGILFIAVVNLLLR